MFRWIKSLSWTKRILLALFFLSIGFGAWYLTTISSVLKGGCSLKLPTSYQIVKDELGMAQKSMRDSAKRAQLHNNVWESNMWAKLKSISFEYSKMQMHGKLKAIAYYHHQLEKERDGLSYDHPNLFGRYYAAVNESEDEQEEAQEQLCASLARAKTLANRVEFKIKYDASIREAFLGKNGRVPTKKLPPAEVGVSSRESTNSLLSGSFVPGDPVARCVRNNMDMVSDGYYDDKSGLRQACQKGKLE